MRVTQMRSLPFLLLTISCTPLDFTNALDVDDDGDGFNDSIETECNTDSLNDKSFPEDFDGDNICDYVDLDDDGDGLSDENETLVHDTNPLDEDSDDESRPPAPDDPLDGATGGVQVELDTVTPPGAMASGSVTFSDGQQKKWTLDQFGRLGLSGGDEGYKPSDDDVMEFQKQLDSALRGKGF